MKKQTLKASPEREFAVQLANAVPLVNRILNAVNADNDGLQMATADMKPGKAYLANAADLGPARGLPENLLFDHEAYRKGEHFANEERFTAAYYSEPLTQYTVGWTDPEDLQAIVNFIAPRVPVGRRFEYKLAVNAEAFLSEIDDERAITSDFKQVEYTGSTQNQKTVNRGLKYRLDLDEEGAGILTEQLIVSRLLQRLRRNQLRRALLTLTNLTATASTSVTWTYNSSTNPNAQPDEQMRAQAARAQVDSGVYPNRLLLDLLSWNIRSATYAQQALGAGAWVGLSRTIQELAANLLIDEGMVIKPIYQSTATAKSYLLGQRAIMFYSQANPTRDDPTNLKHFVTPVGDGDFRVYRQPVGSKFVDISVEHYDNIIATATVGANQLAVS